MRDGDGNPATTVIEVHDGEVRVSVGKTVIALDPVQVSRLRELYLHAQAVALQDRGVW